MAKQKSDENKSQAIRDYLTQNLKAPVKEVRAALDSQGMQVSANLVYLVRKKMLGKQRKQRREAAVAMSKEAGLLDAVELVMQVRQLASQAGGYKNLRQLVEVLEG